MSGAKADVFSGVHKGLRRALFALTSDAARLDVSDAASVERLLDDVHHVLSLMDSHAHHEDTHIVPLVRRVARELGAEMDQAHSDLDARTRIVRHAFERMATAQGDEKAEWAHAAHGELTAYVGAHLVHMAFEERTVLPVLHERVPHDELLATHARLVGSIAPDEMLRFVSSMLPAMNPHERAAMLTGARNGPAEALARLCAVAERVLSSQEWRVLRASAGLA